MVRYTEINDIQRILNRTLQGSAITSVLVAGYFKLIFTSNKNGDFNLHINSDFTINSIVDIIEFENDIINVFDKHGIIYKNYDFSTLAKSTLLSYLLYDTVLEVSLTNEHLVIKFNSQNQLIINNIDHEVGASEWLFAESWIIFPDNKYGEDFCVVSEYFGVLNATTPDDF